MSVLVLILVHQVTKLKEKC